jgi:hypothetical protein
MLKALVGCARCCTRACQPASTLEAQQQQQPGGGRMALALAFRLASKRTLEGATRRVLQRLQALQGQGKVAAAAAGGA